jgi:hypothetical protein
VYSNVEKTANWCVNIIVNIQNAISSTDLQWGCSHNILVLRITCSSNLHINNATGSFRSRGSSVSIVSGYGLDDQAIEVRSPAGAKDFSCSLCVQTGSRDHPASCTIGTGGPFPGGKARPGRDADHSLHLDSVISKWWIGKDLVGSGRGLILKYYPGIHWRDWEKPWKSE